MLAGPASQALVADRRLQWPLAAARLALCALLLSAAAAAEDAGAVFWRHLRQLDHLAEPIAQRDLRALKSDVADLRRQGRETLADLLELAALCTAGDRPAARRRLEVVQNAVTVGALEERLACAEIARRAGNHQLACTLLDGVGNGSTDVMRARAAEVLGDTLLDLRRLDLALERIDLGLATLASIDRYQDHAALEARLRGKQARVRALIRLTSHGLGLHLYADARRRHLDGDASGAIAAYDRLIECSRANSGNDAAALVSAYLDAPESDERLLDRLPIEPVYAEAATVYRAQCLIACRLFDKARAALDRIAADLPSGLYTGEALIARGTLALDVDADPQAAETAFASAIAWAAAVRDLDEQVATLAVPERSRAVTAPPPSVRQVDEWGNALWVRPGPDAVVNRLTTPWYLDRLLNEAHNHRALCLFLLGRVGECDADLRRALALDPIDSAAVARGGLSTIGRLRDGFASGRMHATADEIAAFGPRLRAPLLRAELLFETERWPDAIAAYRSLRLTHAKALRADALGYLAFAEAAALLYAADTVAAERILLEQFAGDRAALRKTLSAPRAMLALANAQQDRDPIRWLTEALELARDTSTRADVLLKIGQYQFARGTLASDAQAEKAFAALAALAATVRADDYRARAARQYLVAITQRKQQ